MKNKEIKHSGWIEELYSDSFLVMGDNSVSGLRFELEIPFNFLKNQQKRFINLGHILSVFTDKKMKLKKIKFSNRKPLTENELAEVNERAKEMMKIFKFE